MTGFGLFGSKSNSKNKTSSTTNTHTTTAPVVPDWASSLTQNAAGRVGDLLHLDPQGLVAPANGLQTHAADWAGDLTGTPWNFAAAGDLTRGAADTAWLDPYMSMDTPFASGGKAYDWVGRYMNPYQQQVVDSTAADLDAHDGQVRAQQALALAGSGAFGGSGAALMQSMTEGELSRARASALGNLRSQGYATALNAASGDADRATQARIANAQMALQDRAQKVGWGLSAGDQRLRAANQLADLSSAYEGNLRADIDTQARLGEMLRGVDQQRREAPIATAQQIVAMLSGLPINLFVGEDKTGTEASNSTSKGQQLSVGFQAGFGEKK